MLFSPHIPVCVPEVPHQQCSVPCCSVLHPPPQCPQCRATPPHAAVQTPETHVHNINTWHWLKSYNNGAKGCYSSQPSWLAGETGCSIYLYNVLNPNKHLFSLTQARKPVWWTSHQNFLKNLGYSICSMSRYGIWYCPYGKASFFIGQLPSKWPLCSNQDYNCKQCE